ncbi:hypothetical protein [Galbibacter sp. PAP.153]|uniref:hypothetical protein n=1 Tax=Galbibacter sp. PAP.153 TaxID=3104623 RepID=UPI00300AFE23
MKKRTLLFILLLIIYSCSSSDDNNNNSNLFNPPKWIQGTWLYIDNEVVVGGYEFTSDNFISIIGENQLRTNFKELLEASQSAGNTPIVDEIITETEYSFTIDQGINSQRFSFYKVSSNKIETGDSLIIYTKQ